MILVIGGTGQVGSEVARQLRDAGEEVRTLSRSDVADVQADLADPASLDAALAGADRVFMATSAGPDQVQTETNAIEAAKRAGVERLVKLSVLGAEAGAPIRFGDNHGRIEDALKGSGLAFTVLRPSGFMQNTLQWAGPIKSQGTVYAPEADAKVAWIDVTDIAAVAVVALTQDGHAGETYALTGPAALSARVQAEAIGRALGRDLEVVTFPASEAKDPMMQAGVPEWTAEALVELIGQVYAEGYAESLADGVQRTTGRPPRSYEDWVAENREAFAG